MAESGESPRLSDELGPVDYLMHRGEANPRTRSGIMALELLDGTPDWDRFRTRFENASRRVLRLRQKVVVPTLPTAAPRWVVDPDFNLDFHVRRVRVSGPATLREVLDLAEVILQSPLDISRPLWTATLVEGMADGRAAMLLHVSHAVTDGVGGVEMFAQIYDLERDPPPRSTPPQPIPEDLSPNDLMRRGINHLPIAVVGGVLDALSGAVSMAGRAVLEPVSTVSGILGYARSGIRVLNRAAEPSPLLRRRSLTTRTEAIDIRLADLHKAAKAGGGSATFKSVACIRASTAATAGSNGNRLVRSSAVRSGVVTRMPSMTQISSGSMRSSQTCSPGARRRLVSMIAAGRSASIHLAPWKAEAE